MRLGGWETSRKSFNWRIRRLVQHGFVEQHVEATFGTEYVYALTNSGADHLEGMGDRFVISLKRKRTKAEEPSIIHSVALNDILLSLARRGLLAEWTPEIEIRSENELTNFAYAKDYDAIVTLRVDGLHVSFALEYERTPKSASQYQEIVRDIKDERHLDQFLYLAANEHLRSFVAWQFRDLQRSVYFGLLEDWHRHLLDMPTFSWKTRQYLPLRQLLQAPAWTQVELFGT
jgi:Replication-relaxation